MWWFKSKSKEHAQEMQLSQLRFLGEQDGTSERALKKRLVAFFQRDQSVKAAYLARVAYGEQTAVNIALCLRTQFGTDHGLAEKTGNIFASMFGRHEHLDIVFLTSHQESALASVCTPFFPKSNLSKAKAATNLTDV